MFPQPYIQSCRFKQMISQHGCSRLPLLPVTPIVTALVKKAANSISEITAIPFSTSFFTMEALYQESQDFS
jgi:hypothetical protein